MEADMSADAPRVTRASKRRLQEDEAPVARRLRGKASRPAAEETEPAALATRASATPKEPPKPTKQAPPRRKKRVREPAAPRAADKVEKPERSSPRSKAKGAAVAAPAKSPAKSPRTKATAAASASSAAAAASGGASSAAGSASPGADDGPPETSNVALQSLLRKLGGGSFEDLFGRSTGSDKFAQMLKGLQTTGNDSAQLQVLSELCELLSMGTEESLRHFSSEAFVPLLMNLLNADWNPDLMLYSCRALTHMMEALPNSQRAVVQCGCVDVLCAKLMSIEYIDLAEQALLALGKLAESHGRSLFRSGGLMAVLSYLDFFPTGVQRAAISTAAAMCRQAPPDCFGMVKAAIPNLTGLLNHHDQRTLESTCTCFIRLSECYVSYPEQLAGLAEHGLIKHLLRLITGWEGSLLAGGFAIAPPVSQPIFTGLIKLLGAVAGSSPKLRQDILDAGAANVIAAMLSPDGRAAGEFGAESAPAAAAPTGSPLLVCNSGAQLVEVLSLVNALLPVVADAGAFDMDLDSKPPAHSVRDAMVASFPKAEPSKPSESDIEGAALLGKTLFALLISVCTSTQNSTVAHKSLRALNKIVSLMPNEKLEELAFGNVARFIGDLLVSTDLVILSGALALAELIMSKMDERFRESFVREGVVHEIRNLGETKRKDALARTGSVDTDTQRLFRTASLRMERAALEQAAMRRRASADGSEDGEGGPPPSPPLESDANVAELVRMRNDPKGMFIEKVQERAQKFRTSYFSDDGSGATTKLLVELREISSKLSTVSAKPCKGAALTTANKAFGRIAELMSDEDKVSVFELSESGLVGSVVKFVCGTGAQQNVTESRTRLEVLCKHFDATGAQQAAGTPALSVFISKLHACIKSQESLPIHLNEIAGGVTEGLRLLSRPFKLRLTPKEGEGSLADLSPNVVLIEPLATIHSVHEFLLAKLTEAHEARERGEPPPDPADGLGSLNRRLAGGAGRNRPGIPRRAALPSRREISPLSSGGLARRRSPGGLGAVGAAGGASAGGSAATDGSATWECDVDGMGTWVEYTPEINRQLATGFASGTQVTFKRSDQTYVVDFGSSRRRGGDDYSQVNVGTGVSRPIRTKAGVAEMSGNGPVRKRRRASFGRAAGGSAAELLGGGAPISRRSPVSEDLLEQVLAEQAELRRALKASEATAKDEATAKSEAATAAADKAAAMLGSDEDSAEDDDDDEDAGEDTAASDAANDEDEDEDDDDEEEVEEDEVFGDGQMETDDLDESVDDIEPSPALGPSRPTSRSPAGGRVKKAPAATKRGSAATSAGAPSASAAGADEDSAADSAPPPLALGDGGIPSKLAFTIRGSVLDNDTTIFHAVQAHGRAQAKAAAAGGAAAAAADDGGERVFAPATRGMWSEIYELQYCRHESLTAKQTSDAASKDSKSDSKSDTGEAGLSDRTLAMALGHDIGVAESSVDSIRDLLVLLRISSWLMTPSRRRQLGLSTDIAEAAAGSGLEQSEVLDSTLTGKVLRQLQDPLALCSGLPGWMDALIRACPDLFSFECKHQYFTCTQLGLSRGLSRLQAAEQAQGVASPAGGRHAGGGADPRSVSLRIQRQKVRISRSRILESATKVLELYGTNKAMLEVEFFSEVGTGLGPTLEFYTISSRELQRKSLGLWRATGVSGSGVDDEYAQPTEFGLFPAPVPLSARKPTHVSGDGGSIRSGREGKQALPDRFRLLGRLMGKALQDNRLLDIHLSPLLYKLLACPAGSVSKLLTRKELSQVDPTLSKTLDKLSEMLGQKEAIDANSSLNASAKKAALAEITYDGAPIDALYLDFTCPGHPDVALCQGGAEKAVTLDNLSEYIDAVVDTTLGSGVTAQVLALRAGFEDALPLAAVDYFEPVEMDRLLCGENAPWTVDELRESCKADHGYTLDSPAVQYLFAALAAMTSAEQRSFLCFATGSPRLPIGGLAALTPPLTIVRRGSDNDGDDPDTVLPTVMTCANYIKLPKYTTAEILKTKLLKAITEGQGSFDLS